MALEGKRACRIVQRFNGVGMERVEDAAVSQSDPPSADLAGADAGHPE